jgi:hypothetical protein
MAREEKRKTVFPGGDRGIGNHEASKEPDQSEGEVSSVPNKTTNATVNLGSPYEVIPEREGSPWDRYRYSYGLELGGPVAVVRKAPATKHLFTMRSFSSFGAEEKLDRLQHLKHTNILASFDIFFYQNSYYIISEHAEISCEEFIVARPDEVQLAAIISQVSCRFAMLIGLTWYRFLAPYATLRHKILLMALSLARIFS